MRVALSCVAFCWYARVYSKCSHCICKKPNINNVTIKEESTLLECHYVISARMYRWRQLIRQVGSASKNICNPFIYRLNITNWIYSVLLVSFKFPAPSLIYQYISHYNCSSSAYISHGQTHSCGAVVYSSKLLLYIIIKLLLLETNLYPWLEFNPWPHSAKVDIMRQGVINICNVTNI